MTSVVCGCRQATSPPIRVMCGSSCASSTTRSARAPAASGSGAPSRRRGAVIALARAWAVVRPTRMSSCGPCAMERALPARCPASSRTTRPSCRTRRPDSRYSPGGAPAAATASLTSTRRRPAARSSTVSVSGARCTPSAITEIWVFGAARNAPTGPGSRAAMPGMALKAWVSRRTPATIARLHCAAVASVCPTATMTPARQSVEIAVCAPESSGARVRMRGEKAWSKPVTSAVVGRASASA